MSKNIFTVKPEYSVRHAAELMKKYRVGSLIVEGDTIGIITATDIIYKYVTSTKGMFVKDGADAFDFALVQRCVRVGGANELDEVGVNPYYHTFFEMFGSGSFGITHTEAIQYMLDLLSAVGLSPERMYFTIPESEDFRVGLEENGIDSSRVFTLGENHSLFWVHWRFGDLGPIGRGLTVIYSNTEAIPPSLDHMADNPDDFVELLTLIDIYGKKSESGIVVEAANPGFDLAIGVERLAAVIQQCNQYETDSVKPLVDVFIEGHSDGGAPGVRARRSALHTVDGCGGDHLS